MQADARREQQGADQRREREGKKGVLSGLLQGQQKPTSTRTFRMFLRGKEARGRDWEPLIGPTLETGGHK